MTPMRTFFKLVAAFLLCSLLSAQVPMTGAGKGTPVAATPPTFFHEANGSSSGSGAGPYTVSLATTDTGLANRRLYAFAVFNHGSESAISACSIGGVACDVVPALLGSGGGSQNSVLVSAPVPTGTPSVVSLTFTGSPGTSPIVYLYSVNSAQLNSTTPVTSVLNQSAVTTITSTVAVLASGSILLLGSGFGGSPSSFSISASTCGLGSAGTFGVTIGGFANGCAANASSSATLSWTGSTAETLWLAALR
jgi:hypothetical protein